MTMKLLMSLLKSQYTAPETIAQPIKRRMQFDDDLSTPGAVLANLSNLDGGTYREMADRNYWSGYRDGLLGRDGGPDTWYYIYGNEQGSKIRTVLLALYIRHLAQAGRVCQDELVTVD